jgi:phage terminase Nu1 subunit (DNA packaging protein)
MTKDLPESFTNVRGRIATISELSSMFGVAPETVRTWVGKGCPVLRKSDGRKGGAGWKFSTADVIEWRLSQVKRERSSEYVDFDEARRRKMAAEAEQAELETAQMRGELVPVDAVAKIMSDQIAACRARLFAIPAGMATILVSATDATEVQSLLEGSIREAAEELIGYVAGDTGTADEESEASAGEGVVGEYETAAETDVQPVGGPIPETLGGSGGGAGAMDHGQE